MSARRGARHAYPEVPEPGKVLALGRAIQDQRARALFFFTYLTGGRLKEVAAFSMNHLWLERGFVGVALRGQQQHGTLRNIYIPPAQHARCLENEMWDEVSAYLLGFGGFERPFVAWRNMSCYLLARMPRSEGKLPSAKLLRHYRAAHCARYYGFPIEALCRFFGWSDARYAQRYARPPDLRQLFERAGNDTHTPLPHSINETHTVLPFLAAGSRPPQQERAVSPRNGAGESHGRKTR